MNRQEVFLKALLDAQRAAFMKGGAPSASVRIDRIDRIVALTKKYQRRFVEAAEADFGCRHPVQTRMEISSIVDVGEHAKKHLAGWMRTTQAKVPLLLRVTGAKAEVQVQPLGVIGIIGPWNFPFQPTLTPLVGAFAAGNRAMLKPSDMTVASGVAMAEAVAEYFSPEEAVVVTGDIETSRAFSRLPFDHILFTGSPKVGKEVMAAAADNLVPVTLELGGKCPVIVAADADMSLAATRIMFGNMQNAGQICLAPDTVFVPRDRMESFVSEARAVIGRWFTSLRDNPDYPAIINERNFDRLSHMVEQARSAGTRIEVINPAGENFAQQTHRKIAPTLVIDPADDLAISQDEIFGPILAVRGYDRLDDVISHVNARPRPLGTYFFGNDKAQQREVCDRITSGGVTINDVLLHASLESLPFGGVGNSGMGAYHGKFGFDRLSHQKAVYRQGRLSFLKFMFPPYKAKHHDMIDRVLSPMSSAGQSIAPGTRAQGPVPRGTVGLGSPHA